MGTMGMQMAHIRFNARKIAQRIFLFTACVTSSFVFAQDNPGWYIGGQAFFSQISDSTDTITTPGTPGSPGTGPNAAGLLGLLFPSTLPPITPAVIPPVCSSPLSILCSGGGGTPPTTGTNPSSNPVRFTYSSGYAVGGTIGYSYAGGLRPELDLSYAQNDVETFTLAGVTDPNPDARVKAFRLFLNGWYDFKWSNTLKPYVGAGVGAQRTRLQLFDSTFTTTAFAYQLGAGINWWFTPKTTVSLDYRFVDSRPDHKLSGGSKLETQLQANQIGLGLKYFFTGESAAVMATSAVEETPAAVVQIQDSDGDGVVDSLDKCPGTPAGVAVDAQGCPLKDSDGDGVSDDKDKCPNTPAGQKVGADGCPLDSDGDGIPDDSDECPNSPAGAKVLPNGCALKGDCRKPRPGEPVDQNGCGLSKNFLLKGVKFEFDSDRLTPESKEILNGVAETLKAYPEVNVEVSGHTDYIGTDAYNLALSEHRADAVKTYLGGRGVEDKRMTPVGYGKTVPIDNNDTEEGRENNRRVEFKIRD